MHVVVRLVEDASRCYIYSKLGPVHTSHVFNLLPLCRKKIAVATTWNTKNVQMISSVNGPLRVGSYTMT